MASGAPIGTRIRKRRQVLGMTQDELAERVGVDRSAVSNWERGRHFPQRYLGKVEDVLGVSLDGEDEARLRPVSDDLRRQIADVLRDDIEAQRRVIGLLEGTLSWPEPDGAEASDRSAR